MQVGVNLPWLDYGWDFGLGPPGWRGSRTTPRWYDEIDRHLQHFRDLGIAVVRWFVLADGLTYGTGDTAPRQIPGARRTWRFEPPPLDTAFLEHFAELLDRFASTERAGRPPLQLLPVLIDFYFCKPGLRPVVREPEPGSPDTSADPGWVKRGRADAIVDPDKRTRFLDRVLDPLLATCRRRPDVIYAWELINEPDWVTRGWHSNPLYRPPVPGASMRAFLVEGKERIRRAGFKATIGFASARTLRTSGVTADISQFHHYPRGGPTLDLHVPDGRFPGIIGEFATAPTDVWPDLGTAGQTVLNRLRLAEARGYSLAIPWSYLGRDRHTDWSLSVEDDVRAFTRAQRA